MNELKRGFVAKRDYLDGVLQCDGIVIRPNGETRNPDSYVREQFCNRPSQDESTEVWDEIAADEIAMYRTWMHGHVSFRIAMQPDYATLQQIAAVKGFQTEFRNMHAAKIDWADTEAWKYDPTGASDLGLTFRTDLSTEQLCDMVKAANAQLEKLPNLYGERPHGLLSSDDEDWYLRVESDSCCYMEREKINRWDVERFLQMVRDYTCYALVTGKRQNQRDEYVHRYEDYRSVIETHGGNLVDVGVDGFCVILHGTGQLYGLNEEDYARFVAGCEALKRSAKRG